MAVSVAGASASMFGAGSGGTNSFTGGLSRKKIKGRGTRTLGPGGVDIPGPQRSQKQGRSASRTPQGPPGTGSGRGIKKKVVRHGSPRGSVSRVTPGVKSRPTGGGRGTNGLGPKAKQRMGRLLTRGATRV